MLSLALTLGHNSSAVLIKNGEVVIGYEQERLSGIKSDSSFPKLAIAEIGKYHDLTGVYQVYVSHWATFGNIDEMSEKHWDRRELEKICPNAKVLSHITGFSHHDAHAEAARVFAEIPYEWEIVADGFGNYNETLSIYQNGKLAHRCFGFEKSIGLYYQYATAYLGLKMNQDEYKLLGFEADILNVLDNPEIGKIQEYAEKQAKKFSKKILNPQLVAKYDLVAGLSALPIYRLKVENDLKRLIPQTLKVKNSRFNDYEHKVIVAFFVQSVVEMTLEYITNYFGMDEVLLSGGVFMNVKVNNSIAKRMDCICVYPICGDQGAGLGVYQYYRKDLIWPDHLFWGKRNLTDEGESTITYVDTIDEAIDISMELLKKDKIVNLIHGAMEFGARALGHTSTLALPTKANVRYINHLNKRETTMPMAGMVTSLKGYAGYHKVDSSLKYMVVTLDSKDNPSKDTLGVHHKYPLGELYSNRVQFITKDNELHRLVSEFEGGIINTSANFHGQTIPCTKQQVLDMHLYQKGKDGDGILETVIVRSN